MIIQGLKPRIFNKLNKFGRRWLTELPSVIWSLRTTPSRATGFSPFFLVYGAEAILPTDLEYGSPRLKAYQEQQNQRAREDLLDQVDEARDVALLHSARYQQSLRRYQVQRVRRRDLNKGDLVLRLRQDNRGRHKLSLPWEGPYIIAEVLKPGTYKLVNEKAQTRHVQTGERKRRSPLQCLEHTTATSLLSLEFQAICTSFVLAFSISRNNKEVRFTCLFFGNLLDPRRLGYARTLRY